MKTVGNNKVCRIVRVLASPVRGKLRRTSGRLIVLVVMGLLAGIMLVGGNRTRASGDLIISTPTPFANLDASDGSTDGKLTVGGNLTILGGGSINCNDPALPAGNSACPIIIDVSGNMAMKAGSAIFAENRTGGGNGADITITVGGTLTLDGNSGATPGAIISSSKLAGAGGGQAGDITIHATGVNSDVDLAPGSKVLADSTQSAGAIEITAGHFAAIDGLVSSTSTLSGTGAVQAPGGGPITIKAVCTLSISDAGVVSSRGKDPGADLVHLEGCDVVIEGLVESTGVGHAIPNRPANHLDGANRPDKPSNSTAGVEVWAGGSLTIDRSSTHNGEINADTGGPGGSSGTSWIDLFARGGVNITGDSTGKFAVHANGNAGTNDNGGVVTVKSVTGKFSATGLAIQADAANPGGKGGSVTVEAASDVKLDTASIFARGDFNQGGGYGFGGDVAVRSFTSTISWQNGVGDVRPTGTDNVGTVLPPANRGEVTFQKCTAGFVDTSGTLFPNNGLPATTPAALPDDCVGVPTLPFYVMLPTCDCAPPEQTCETCDGNTVVVDHNVTVNFNTNPPTCSGDADLCAFFTFDNSGPTADTWKAIFDVGAKKLLVKSGATITVSQVGSGNNRRAPGIVIRSTCELEVEEGGAIVVESLNLAAGDILIEVTGNVTINGTVSDSVRGTAPGGALPGDITIASCCGNINTGPKSLIQTNGVDPGGSDINLLACDGDIVINGLVDANYHGHGLHIASTINVLAFNGSVTVDGNNVLGTEPGTGRIITSGVTVRGSDPVPGAINIQAKKDITVLGNSLLTTNPAKFNFGAVAVKTGSNSSKGGKIDVRSLEGTIVASDRAFDDANRYNSLALINLQAKGDIDLSVTASKNAGAPDNTKDVVSTKGEQGGTNALRSFSGGISIGVNARVVATVNGSNLLTSCLGVINGGTVDPADAAPGDDTGKCDPAAPDAIFRACQDFRVCP